jgi:hypothetical protein
MPSSRAFQNWQPCRNLDGGVKNCHRVYEVFPSDVTSFFIARWKTGLKSHACCTAHGIFRRCLNKPAMEANPIPRCGTYNQDDATGFIQLNALCLKVAAKVQKHK